VFFLLFHKLLNFISQRKVKRKEKNVSFLLLSSFCSSLFLPSRLWWIKNRHVLPNVISQKNIDRKYTFFLFFFRFSRKNKPKTCITKQVWSVLSVETKHVAWILMLWRVCHVKHSFDDMHSDHVYIPIDKSNSNDRKRILLCLGKFSLSIRRKMPYKQANAWLMYGLSIRKMFFSWNEARSDPITI